QAAGLSFVALTWERFDLVLRHRDYFLPGPQALFGLMRTAAFRERANELGGYDIGEAGSVRLGKLTACDPGRPRRERGATPPPATIVRAPLNSRSPAEGWPSGLRRTLGKRVYGKPYRGFESHSLRHAHVVVVK